MFKKDIIREHNIVKDDEVVECYSCKALLFKKSITPVKHSAWSYRELYYCDKCRPNYDEAFIVNDGDINFGYDKTTYLKNRVEVDKKGKPIIKK